MFPLLAKKHPHKNEFYDRSMDILLLRLESVRYSKSMTFDSAAHPQNKILTPKT